MVSSVKSKSFLSLIQNCRRDRTIQFLQNKDYMTQNLDRWRRTFSWANWSLTKITIPAWIPIHTEKRLWGNVPFLSTTVYQACIIRPHSTAAKTSVSRSECHRWPLHITNPAFDVRMVWGKDTLTVPKWGNRFQTYQAFGIETSVSQTQSWR